MPDNKTKKNLLILAIITIGSTLLIWLPFILDLKSFWNLIYPGGGVATLWRNFDGLNYIAVAKSFYNPLTLQENFSSLGLAPIYFASHFPLYPMFIALASPVFGFLNGMLIVTTTFSVLSVWIFYLLVKDFKLTENPLWLSLIFLALPARWVIVRSVGSNEPLFIFLVLATFYLTRKSKYFLAGIVASLAVWTRSPAVILVAALGFSVFGHWLLALVKNHKVKFPTYALPLIAFPIAAALGLFYLYFVQFGDFFAYFHSGDNIHLTLPPFPVFNKEQYWVGTFWLENIIYVYLFLAAGAIVLWQKKLYDLAIFVGLFFIASSFIAHLDIGRYILPAFPFVLIAFEKFLVSREFKIAFIILLIPIYLFTQNFLIGNISPITDFTPFR